MSAFIAVEIATKDTVNQKVPSAHLFVDVESSKVDYQNSQPEMKMEENPSSIDVNKIAEETAEGGDLAGEEWTCPWCYRENPGDVLRCPACDRFKISDAACKGTLGELINYVKVHRQHTMEIYMSFCFEDPFIPSPLACLLVCLFYCLFFFISLFASPVEPVG